MGFKIFLENRWKNKLHIFMLLLIVAVMGLAGARMVMITGQRARSDSMALAMVRSINLIPLPLAPFPFSPLKSIHIADEILREPNHSSFSPTNS
jgi:hypothetical protein